MTAKHTHRSKKQDWAPVVILLVVYGLALVGLLILACLVRRPEPVVAPPVYSDTTHQAIDGYSHQYTIDMAYGSMNDVQRGDANRFAREYPDGKG